MAFDPNKPATGAGRTMAQVVADARANDNDLNDRLVAVEGVQPGATRNELVLARGNRPALADRLGTSLDADGNLRFASLMELSWAALGDVPTYIAATQFRVPGNRTAAYFNNALLRLTAGAAHSYGAVLSTAFDAGNNWTVITLQAAVVPAAVAAVALGVAQINRFGDPAVDFNARDLVLARRARLGNLYDLPHELALGSAAYMAAETVRLRLPQTGVAAAGTVQGDAFAVNGWAEQIEITTGAANSGIILPRALPGLERRVFNRTANTIKVYPAGTEQIDALGAGAAISLSAGTSLRLDAPKAGQWFS